MQGPDEVMKFWFEDHTHQDWFGGEKDFDHRLHERFFELHGRVAAGEAWTWRSSASGRVAEILVLDQFSRQFYRGEARAFAQDPMALALAQEMVILGLDTPLEHGWRMFVYMPYMHSESPVVHEEAVRLFKSLGDQNALDYELRHKELIERFGRYPKRNEALGRTSTEEELAYIAERSDSHF